mgnify:CR=1 FL=1
MLREKNILNKAFPNPHIQTVKIMNSITAETKAYSLNINIFFLLKSGK